MSRDEAEQILILDANVLIDYRDSDISILTLASQRYHIYVAGPVLTEVERFDEDECERVGLRILQPSVEQVIEAGRGSQALSFQDRLCLALAEEKALTVVTNDKRLRSECIARDIAVKWGLEIMLDLLRAGQLGSSDALAVAESMHETSPHFVTKTIVQRFRRQVRRAARKGRKK